MRGDLLTDWRRSLPADVPNNFLINIRPDERAPLEEFLKSHGFGQPAMYPMVRARITAINGAPERIDQVQRRLAAAGFLEREQNLTWSSRLMEDNQLIAGALVDGRRDGKPLGVHFHGVSGSARPEARRHSELRCGRREALTVRVASIRKVRWDSFRPKFLSGISARAPGRRRRHLYDQRVPDAAAAARAGRSGAASFRRSRCSTWTPF